MGKGGQKQPSGPEMKSAWKSYEAGDMLRARREARAVLAGGPSDADKQQAADLLERTQFPKMGLILVAVAAGLILLMLLVAITRS